MIKLTSIRNHIRCINLSIIITIKFYQLMLRCRCLAKFSLSGRDGNLNRFLPSWGFIPNTHPINLISGCLGSPLVQLRNKFVGPPRSTLLGSPLCQVVNLTFGLTPIAPRTSLLPPECALSLFGSQPEFSYSASRSKRVIQPTK